MPQSESHAPAPLRRNAGTGDGETTNNTAIANMLRGGLPEGTVVLAIQRAIAYGNTDFDASTQALIDLKNAGATEPVLNFILTAPTIQRYEPSTM